MKCMSVIGIWEDFIAVNCNLKLDKEFQIITKWRVNFSSHTKPLWWDSESVKVLRMFNLRNSHLYWCLESCRHVLTQAHHIPPFGHPTLLSHSEAQSTLSVSSAEAVSLPRSSSSGQAMARAHVSDPDAPGLHYFGQGSGNYWWHMALDGWKFCVWPSTQPLNFRSLVMLVHLSMSMWPVDLHYGYNQTLCV